MDIARMVSAGVVIFLIAGCVSAHGTGCGTGGHAAGCQPTPAAVQEAARNETRWAGADAVIPQLTPRPPAAGLPNAGMAPSTPVVKGICSPGGCTGTDAQTYQGGGGTTYLNSGGRLCHRNGVWMQCF